jgi:hypothetical protein
MWVGPNQFFPILYPFVSGIVGVGLLAIDAIRSTDSKMRVHSDAPKSGA